MAEFVIAGPPVVAIPVARGGARREGVGSVRTRIA